MAEPEVEAAWRAELNRAGETSLTSGGGFTGASKRPVGFCWSGDEAEARRLREEQTHHYVRWAFFVAVAAMIAFLIVAGVALLH